MVGFHITDYVQSVRIMDSVTIELLYYFLVVTSKYTHSRVVTFHSRTKFLVVLSCCAEPTCVISAGL